MWRLLRITLLLLVLAIVAGRSWLDRSRTTAWREPLWVGIYPLNGDGSDASRRYLDSLDPASFADIERFFAEQGARYRIGAAEPVHVELYPSPAQPPPILGRDAGLLATMWWSLKLRWYAAHVPAAPGQAAPQIRMFVLYRDPGLTATLPHSAGLEKGLIGVVYAFADRSMRGSNSIVIAHELMHTLGATDKYDARSDAPLYPQGYAEPARRPLYPQPFAEIMAGRRALSARDFEMPDSLRDVRVGPLTAAEIRWIR